MVVALINGPCFLYQLTTENCVMSKPNDLPKNKMGGLNLNLAITQALTKLGPRPRSGTCGRS